MIKYIVVNSNTRIDFTSMEAAQGYVDINGGTIETVTEPEATYAPLEIEVPMWKLRAVLSFSNLLAPLEAAIDTLPEPNKTIAMAAWNYGNFILRSSSFVIAIQQMLQLTNDQTDNLFIQAEQLPS